MSTALRMVLCSLDSPTLIGVLDRLFTGCCQFSLMICMSLQQVRGQDVSSAGAACGTPEDEQLNAFERLFWRRIVVIDTMSSGMQHGKLD